MLVGKRRSGEGSILKRTSSITGINKEVSDTETILEAPPSDNNSIDNSIPHFLRTCRLCHRRLAAGRDIYMYRGDTAFCSFECREEQMKEDERKDNNQWKNKNKVSSMNKQQQDPPPPSTAAAAAQPHTTQLAAA
ncbi:hypothetical protein QN277_026011 [Acacia crassicarpa]|uniref:FLZ-type domain-containing protein n=1 Tax=Acacia crassicarpa TaxID=499986 RepID=A0AAE1MEX9_9FABA|nr:hypothetical protein QN277_026011 [Acacia crassicarpa]